MTPETILPFVGMIVSACIIGGALTSGLVKVAEAIERSGARRD